jgi:hypothetical protein
MKTVVRVLTAILGIVALLVVAALWYNPDGTAQTFGIKLGGPVARAVVRADLAGLFLALGIASLLAAAYQRREFASAALFLTAMVAVGRVINLVVVGVAPELLAPLGLEVVMMAVYFGGARLWAPTRS